MPVSELLKAALEKSAVDFTNIFEEEMRSRIARLIEEKKEQMKEMDDDEEYEDDDDEEYEDDDDDDEELEEANMSDEEVLKVANRLKNHAKNVETRSFAKGLITFHKKNGGFSPNQVSALQNIIKQAPWQMTKTKKKAQD